MGEAHPGGTKTSQTAAAIGMALGKHKRIHVENELAWVDYQLANGAPDGPEEQAGKVRRITRISIYKSRLIKEDLEDNGRRLGNPSVGTTRAQSVPADNAERPRTRRAGLSQEEQETGREHNTERQRELRAELTPDEQEEELNQRERARRDAEEDEARKETTRIRRKCVRRGHALANHEDFDKSVVSGKIISNGHHLLPAIYACG
ncbi:hypothetical protein PF005_g11977 [Phytophthora fragariae]|uniref:Uncharacterized protein n=1 Tax=Phytophthora fragariae TaxID=53985 RepID=A0A6A3XVG5_9STRA|nr:hypothetical protein PF005_g11977 [Phytophthora fragariae]